jgi:hypothetical protein
MTNGWMDGWMDGDKLMVGVEGHIKAAVTVFLNQLLLAVPLQCLLYPYFVYMGMHTDAEVPSGMIFHCLPNISLIAARSRASIDRTMMIFV